MLILANVNITIFFFIMFLTDFLCLVKDSTGLCFITAYTGEKNSNGNDTAGRTHISKSGSG